MSTVYVQPYSFVSDSTTLALFQICLIQMSSNFLCIVTYLDSLKSNAFNCSVNLEVTVDTLPSSAKSGS